jgi:AraC-like DNA-binding protein
VQASHGELTECLARAIPTDGVVEPLTGVRLGRASRPSSLGFGVSDTALCVIAQGSKEVVLGGDSYRYDPAHYLITTAALPVAYRVTEASEERPYLTLVLRLDRALVASVIAEAGHPAPQGRDAVRAIDVSPLDPGLLDAAVRLVGLLDSPGRARVLAPLVIREIVYRLLEGAQGGRLSQLAVPGGHAHRVARAVERLRREFDRSLRVEELARELGMGASAFHHHFKALTGMTPLQFQKQLRLQEARRLLLAGDADAASVGHRVGYRDASQFSREYRRLFGAPPMRDLDRLRGTDRAAAGG